MAEFPFQWGKSFREGHWILCQVHENETFPECKVDSMERMFSFIEAIDMLHMRRAQQSPIQPIGPGVIRTLDNLGEMPLLRFAHPGPAMTADIVEPVQLALLVADNDQTLSRNLCEQIVACVFQLALMPHTKPFGRKDALSFLCKNFLRNEILLRQSLHTNGECFSTVL